MSAVRAVIDRVLTNATAALWVSPHDLDSILRAVGIECAPAESTTPTQAVATAERLGYPLVAKVISQDIVHKSDMGGVIMGLQNQTDITTAVELLVQRTRDIGARLDGILLQREVAGGVEALVGVSSDPTFGPLLVCGLGGTLVEIFRVVAFRVPPVTDVDAVDMLAKLHAGRLLDGYRGAPAADREALIGVILRISVLIECIPEMLELDLNPLKVRPKGQGAIVIDGRMRLSPLTT